MLTGMAVNMIVARILLTFAVRFVAVLISHTVLTRQEDCVVMMLKTFRIPVAFVKQSGKKRVWQSLITHLTEQPVPVSVRI
jgi:hypothetical protein